MRPPRIAILAFFFGACLFILGRAVASAARPAPPLAVASHPIVATKAPGSFSSLFSFSAPFILFPPNAVITIADDNTTSFAARPAAFGPPLPALGLTGQLWIGSGFTEETLQDGEGEGERGCSDAPNWDDGTNSVLTPIHSGSRDGFKTDPSLVGSANSRHGRKGPADSLKASILDRVPASNIASKSKPPPIALDDGTDDYLHQGLGGKPVKQTQSDAFGLDGVGHADIQSIQEGAEIAGKIVLLSRGGCGFLEKAKWAQRRGAVALIVGDNQRGGPLIQMFAKGDTSNVTIPSIFTSRTTAYLLSLMMQSGTALEDVMDEHGKLSLKASQLEKTVKNKKPKDQTSDAAQSMTSSGVSGNRGDAFGTGSKSSPSSDSSSSSGGWFSHLFRWGAASASSDSSRPPRSGRLEWEVVEDFNDESDALLTKSKSAQAAPDDFKIGVQDWRDPDLVGASAVENHVEANTKTSTKGKALVGSASGKEKRAAKAKAQNSNSITPGSGEYIANNLPPKDHDAIGKTKDKTPPARDSPGGLISKLFGSHESSVVHDEEHPEPIIPPPPSKPEPGRPVVPPHREGLWVVITPSSGASPFFDTLLVLVISPLITLTVVYAMLILRARIRRRRWRAPKSVVERLPVRTYQTVVTTPSQQNSRQPSPTSSSPTTPLLQSAPELPQLPQRPRPRSRTTTGVPTAEEVSQADPVQPAPRQPKVKGEQKGEHEKRGSEWKKYMGRQVECVVCLEEYIDGVSQVMSLPCGHEFHVDCITPWLTTRRRTCPICKGDVVRSLAHGSSSGPRYEPYHDDSEDDDASLHNSMSSSSSSAREEHDADVERGASPSHNSNQESWLDMVSNALRLRPASRRDDRSEQDRNR